MPRDLTDIARLATRQQGKLAREQLVDLGLPLHAIRSRIRAGTLIPDQRGVFAVGHVPDTHLSRWSGAVLAAGTGAALSHLAAARLLGLLSWDPERIDVSRARRTRPLPGVRIHATRLDAEELTQRDGIAVTNASRTIADCAQVLSPGQLVGLMREARHLGLLDLDALERYVDPAPRRHGAPCLREALQRFRGRSRGYRSRLETDVHDVLVARGAPEPLINVPWATDRGEVEADQSWPELNIVVEVDGPTHVDPEQARADRRNREALRRAGWDVYVVDHEEFRNDPTVATDSVIAAIRARMS